MRNRFDQLGKELGVQALGALGPTDVQYALNAETLFVDLRHEPEPGHDEERRRLGLLGELTRSACLIELYSQPPGLADLRTCVAKHLLYAQERVRAARARGAQTPLEGNELWTWIISAGVPRGLLAGVAFRPAPETDAAGVYVLGGDLEQLGVKLGLVVACELPAVRATLLVRLMAGGALLPAAVHELASLSRDAYERIVAMPVLLHFQHVLEHETTRPLGPEEQEFTMIMHKNWDDAREEGREEGRVAALRRLVALKFGEISPEVEQRLTAAPPDEIDRLLERVLFADSIDALFG